MFELLATKQRESQQVGTLPLIFDLGQLFAILQLLH